MTYFLPTWYSVVAKMGLLKILSLVSSVSFVALCFAL